MRHVTDSPVPMFVMYVRGCQLGENNPNDVDEKYEIYLQEIK